MKTADNGVLAHLRLCDTIVRGNNGRKGSRRASERIFHPSENLSTLRYFRRYNNIIEHASVIKNRASFTARDKKYSETGGYKKFSGSKNFYSFSTRRSWSLPPSAFAPRVAFCYSFLSSSPSAVRWSPVLPQRRISLFCSGSL